MHAFFETRLARFHTVDAEGRVAHTTVEHPWQGPGTLKLCTGRIYLVDHAHRVVEAFCLGGEVEIVPHAEHTSCVVTSTAPIFDLAAPGNDVMTLVIELEALLARFHAQWGTDDAGFAHCLASADPLELFMAGLESITEHLAEVPFHVHNDLRYQQTVAVVHAAIRGLQEAGVWPTPAPNLDELLAAPAD
jgi:hypothetical protein